MRRASFCTDSIVSSKYFGRAAQTGLTEPPTVRGTGGGDGLYYIKLMIIYLHFFELSFTPLKEAYV